MSAAISIAHSQLVVAAGAVLALGVFTALAMVWWVRRRWRRLRRAVVARLAAAMGEAGQAGWRWLLARPLPDRRWRAIIKTRRQLLGSVSAAEGAVAAARAAGAPLGDLDSLSRRLRSEANVLDTALLVAQRQTVRVTEPVQTSARVNELIQVAAHIQEAACLAAGPAGGPLDAGLAQDAERELAAVSAGVRRSTDALGTIGVPRLGLRH